MKQHYAQGYQFWWQTTKKAREVFAAIVINCLVYFLVSCFDFDHLNIDSTWSCIVLRRLRKEDSSQTCLNCAVEKKSETESSD